MLPSASRTRVMSRGRTAKPPLGNTENAVVSDSGVTSPVPSASDGTSGRFVQTCPIGDTKMRRVPTRCWRSVAARLLDSISAARNVSASGASSLTLRGVHSSGPCGSIRLSPVSVDTGDRPRSSAAANTNGLNADPGCRRLRLARLKAERA